MATSNSEHVQFIHDRLVNVHGENENYDYMIRLREIIRCLKGQEVFVRGLDKAITKHNAKVDTEAEQSRLDAENLRSRVPPITST